MASSTSPLVIVPCLAKGNVTIYCDSTDVAHRSHGFDESAFGLDALTVLDVLVSIAEPVSRPHVVHEYRITPYSLGAGVSRGFTPENVYRFLRRHCMSAWPGCVDAETSADDMAQNTDRVYLFIRSCMGSYHKARVFISADRCAIECVSKALAVKLRKDPVIASQSKGDVYDIVQRNGNSTAVVPYAGAAARARSPAAEDTAVSVSPYVAGFDLIDAAARKFVADKALTTHGIPLQQQYHFEGDSSLPTMHLALRTSTKPRDYQVKAVEAAVGLGTCSSGVIVLPCGAGKTLVGIMLLCAVKKPAIILCASAVSVEQWKNQILDFAAFDQQAEMQSERDEAAMPAGTRATAAGMQRTGAARGVGNTMLRPSSDRLATRIACFTGKQKDKVTEYTKIIITTYSMLSVAHRAFANRQAAASVGAADDGRRGAGTGAGSTRSRNATQQRSQQATDALFRPEGWGLLVLDEVHVVPADFFREALSALKAKSTIGLTATYVREDAKILDLHHLVGPKLFDVSWEDLQARGFLADVTCIEVHCRMTPEFGVEYLTRKQGAGERTNRPRSEGGEENGGDGSGVPHVAAPLLIALAAANPNKMACAVSLAERHRGAKTIVFCDYIELLKKYAQVLNCPMVHGETAHHDRMKIFSDFECTGRLNLIAVSRVGDVSVNLPSASVVIQVSSHGGSRRQEAQRLGRILRPKPKNTDGTSVHAFFYSLISDDTIEAGYAAHRTAFLVDQGYTCRLETYQSPLHTLSLRHDDDEDDDDRAVAHDAAATADAEAALPPMLRLNERLSWLARCVAQWESIGAASRRNVGGKRSRISAVEGEEDDAEGYSSDAVSADSGDGDGGEERVRVKRERAAEAPRRRVARTETTLMAAATAGADDVVYHEFH
jgi:DNA excision repair protein ERCC-3